MTPIGRVVSVYGTRIVRISVESNLLNEVSRPGTYIKIPVNDISLYGLILGFSLIDEFYKRVGSPSRIEGYEGLDLSRNEVNACLVGYRDENGLHRGVILLPRPGSKVYMLSDDEYREIMSRGDINIGSLVVKPSIPVSIDMNGLLSRHFAILAMTGAGKSNLVALLLMRILEKYSKSRILLIDTHSEYLDLHSYVRDKLQLKSSVYCPREYKVVGFAEDLEVPYWLLSLEEMYSILNLDSKATKQRLILRAALKKLRGEDRVDEPVFFELKALNDIIERDGRDRSADELKAKLDDFASNKDLKFISSPRASLSRFKELKDKLGDYINASYAFAREFMERLLGNNLSIIALGGLPFEAQDTVVSTILRLLWQFIVKERIERGVYYPTLIVIEEAHVYASGHRASSSREIISRIAREGRKFGISLGLVSQRPRELYEAVLSQCGNLMH